jgi:hypothetical protein
LEWPPGGGNQGRITTTMVPLKSEMLPFCLAYEFQCKTIACAVSAGSPCSSDRVTALPTGSIPGEHTSTQLNRVLKLATPRFRFETNLFEKEKKYWNNGEVFRLKEHSLGQDRLSDDKHSFLESFFFHGEQR